MPGAQPSGGLWVAWREHGEYGTAGQPELAYLSTTGLYPLERLPFFELAGGVLADAAGNLYWAGRLRPTTSAAAALPLPELFAATATTAAGAASTTTSTASAAVSTSSTASTATTVANSSIRTLTVPGLVAGPQRTWAGSGASLHPAGLLWTGREASVDGVRPVLFVLPAPVGGKAGSLTPAVQPGRARTDPIPFLDQVMGLQMPSGYLGPVFVRPGGELTLTGTNFGASPGIVQVLVGGQPAHPVSWSDTQVKVSLAAGTPAGKVDVEVQGSGEARAVPQQIRVKTGDVPGVLQVMRVGFPALTVGEEVTGTISVRGESVTGTVEKSAALLTGLSLLDLPNGTYTLRLTATVRTRQWEGVAGTWIWLAESIARTFSFKITDDTPAVVFTF